jgi:hypothetical protein
VTHRALEVAGVKADAHQRENQQRSEKDENPGAHERSPQPQ